MISHDGEHNLPESDARSLVRLLADVVVTPGGIAMQKRCLMEGLKDVIDADYWLWNVARLARDEAPTAISVLHNLSDHQFALMADDNYSNKASRLHADKLVELTRTHEHWTRTIGQIVELEDWEDTELYRWYRDHLDFEHSIMSCYRLPDDDGLGSCVGFHRGKGCDPFTPREIRMVDMVTREVEWLHRMGVPEQEDGQRTMELSPRLRTVLTMLMDGQAPKQIARNLYLSDHTVRGYIKDIYRHFDVSGRAELMRKFMTGDGGGH